MKIQNNIFDKQRLVRMNMPVADDGTVHFTTTLFALIRESLRIKIGATNMCMNDEFSTVFLKIQYWLFSKFETILYEHYEVYKYFTLRTYYTSVRLVLVTRVAEEQDRLDDEFRHTLVRLWPLQSKRNLNLFIPWNYGKQFTNQVI